MQENEIVRWLEPRLASGGRLLAVYLFGLGDFEGFSRAAVTREGR